MKRYLFSILFAIMILTLVGCEYWVGIKREATLETPIPEECVRQALKTTSEISSVKEYAWKRGKSFHWDAQRDILLPEGQRDVLYAHGWVAISLEKHDRFLLEMETGKINGIGCKHLAFGKTIMDRIYENIRANCPNAPPSSSLKWSSSRRACTKE